MWKISWLAEDLPVCQEGLYFSAHFQTHELGLQLW